MTKRWLVPVLLLTAAVTSGKASGPEPHSSKTERRPVVTPVNAPLFFEANHGQTDARVKFLSRGSNYTLALTPDEAMLAVGAKDPVMLRMRLEGANRQVALSGVDPLPGKIYYADVTKKGPLTPYEMFERVKYSNVYSGIDLVYYGNNRELEFDFVVAPHADPKQIRLSLTGTDQVAIDRNGELSMRARGTKIRLKRPIIYQERDGVRHDVRGGYALSGKKHRILTFKLDRYDPSLPLVIDPTWIFGSAAEDYLVGLEVDSAGQPHVLSTTMDPDTVFSTVTHPGTLPPPNCVVSKLDTATASYSYVLVFKNMNNCDAMTLSPNDVTYVAGFTLTSVRATMIAQLNESSGAMVMNTYTVTNYDSSAIGDGITALAANSLEHLFLIGPCRVVGSGEPPLVLSGYNETPNPANGTYAEACTIPPPGQTGTQQPIVTALDSDGSLLYASFLAPGVIETRTYGLAADASDRAFIVGTNAPMMTPTVAGFDPDCATQFCAYLMELDTTTTGPSSLLHSQFLWRLDDAQRALVRLGPTGEVYVAFDGRVTDNFPNNRPTNPYPWEFTRFPDTKEGLQLARFDLDVDGIPSQFNYAFIFNAWTALAGTFGDHLTDLRVLPSGAPVVANIKYETGVGASVVRGTVTTFYRSGELLAQRSEYAVDPHSGGSDKILVAADGAGNLYAAFQRLRAGTGPDLDVWVDHVGAPDPGLNTPPAFSANDVTVVMPSYHDSGAFVSAFNYFYYDAEDGVIPAGGSCDRPLGSYFLLGTTLVTCTFHDSGGLSVTGTFNVIVNQPPYEGAPFVGNTARPPDSTSNAGVFNYTPVTISTLMPLDPNARAFLTTRLDQNPPIPSTLQAGSPPMYFELSTTGTQDGFFGVCIDTAGMSFPYPGRIRLYRFESSIGVGGLWQDVTDTRLYANHGDVCGWTETLGTFAILYDQVPATAIETVAGNGIRAGSIDGPGGDPSDDFVAGPAKSTPLGYLFGGAYDRTRNLLYFSDFSFIYRLNVSTNVVTRIAGNGAILGAIDGPGGNPNDDFVEDGHPFNTYVGVPGEMTVDSAGSLVFLDRNTCRIRKVDTATGRLVSVAGNGTCGYAGDGFNALGASLNSGQMTYDVAGNLFIADTTAAVIRRVDHTSNIITTVAGDGTFGIPANGSPLATISMPRALVFDHQGYLLVAGGMHLLRISPGANGIVDGGADETMTVIGGCNTNCQAPFGGDGLALTDPTHYLPGMGYLVVAQDGAIIFSDYHRIRRIAPGADGVVTGGAADEYLKTIGGYFDFVNSVDNYNGDTFATQSLLAPFGVMAEDAQGRVLIVDTNNFRVRRFGFVKSAGPDSADLHLTASASASSVQTGGPVNYGLRVKNNGPADTNVTVNYTLPAGVVFDHAYVLTGSCTTPTSGQTGTVTCNLGTIESGTDRSLEIGVIANTSGTLISTFSLSSPAPDPNLTDNTVTMTTTVTTAMVVFTINETIFVADAPAVLPSAMIRIDEQIHVTDGPAVLPSAMLTINETIVVADAPAVTPAVPADTTPPVLTLPGNLTRPATGPSGASVTWFASALDDVSGAVPAMCNPTSGATFPIATTTVTCTATDAAGNVATGNFTVTVAVGVPNISVRIYNRGTDSTSYYVTVEWANTGTGHSPLYSLSTLTFRTLTGTGTVTSIPQNPLPIEIPNFPPGGATFGMLRMQVPGTVKRFSITFAGTYTNALGAVTSFSSTQTVIP